MLELVPVVGAVMDVIMGLVMVLFVLSTLLLILVILIQEGKGGGVAGVFGGGFTETFGVKAGTVNRFTAWLAACFLGLALLYAGLAAGGETPKFKRLQGNPVSPPTESLPGVTPTSPAVPAIVPPTAPPTGPATPPGTPPAGGSSEAPKPPADQPPAPPAEHPPQAPPEAPPSPPPGGGTPPAGGTEQPR